MHQELADLRQSKKETKRLLFEKSQEALLAHSKILPLRNEVIELKDKAEEVQAKMAKLEERATQQEVRLGKGELAHKVKLFNQTEEELTYDVADAYGAGFEDALAQVDGIFMKVFLNHVRKWCGSYEGVCARSS